MARKGTTTIPILKATRDSLSTLKLAQGDETWEHLLLRGRAALVVVGRHPELAEELQQELSA